MQARRRNRKPEKDAAFGHTPKRKPASIDFDRAQQIRRGREATSPFAIPWLGWKDILWQTYEQAGEDRLFAIAGGVVFFGLLAAFPAVAAFVSLYGLIADASTINEHLAWAAGILPAGALDLLREQVARLTANRNSTLGIGFVTGLAIALWSANAGMKAIIDALNVIYGETEKRSFVRLTLVAFAFTLGILCFMLAAVSLVVALPIAFATVGLGSYTELLFRIGRWPALLIVLIAGLAILYRYGPSRREPRWEWVSVGSVLAAALWLASSVILSWYLESFADYDATYGSLGAGVGLMMWMWVSAIVILAGAELNSEVEHQTAEDSTVGARKPLGARGAAMADTVGQSLSRGESRIGKPARKSRQRSRA